MCHTLLTSMSLDVEAVAESNAYSRHSDGADVVAATQVPLDSAQRVEPIHPAVPEVKMPFDIPNSADSVASDPQTKSQGVIHSAASMLNPVTLSPFTVEELRSHHVETLLHQYTSAEAANKARDDTAKELRKLLDENERKRKDIEREMEEKEKTREIERKVYARKLGKDV